MDSHHNLEVDEKQTIHFGSGSRPPFFRLSNFHECEVRLGGRMFPSAEHAFQAQLGPDPQLYTQDSVIGKLSEDAFMHLGVKKQRAPSKVKYWQKKRNVGILAKMLVNRHKKQGLKRTVTGQQCKELFLRILRLKFADPELRDVLLGTGDAYLLEFDKGAGRAHKKNHHIVRWGGMVEDGRIVGHNQMGALLMELRSEMRPAPHN